MPQIVDPSGSAPTIVIPAEPEILAGRRAFYKAQELLAGSATGPAMNLEVGWHGSSVNREDGSFAVVALGGGLDDLIGEIVVVRFRARSVFAYVLTSADVPVALSLTRRTFAALSRLSVESIAASVAVST